MIRFNSYLISSFLQTRARLTSCYLTGTYNYFFFEFLFAQSSSLQYTSFWTWSYQCRSQTWHGEQQILASTDAVLSMTQIRCSIDMWLYLTYDPWFSSLLFSTYHLIFIRSIFKGPTLCLLIKRCDDGIQNFCKLPLQLMCYGYHHI